MDIASGLIHGFAVALQPANLLWCFVGVFLGTIVGIMPGLGPPATIAMLLPLTALINPTGAIIMLAGRSMVKALLATLVGLWIAGIGTDAFTSQSRFTFGRMELLSGIDFVVVAIGIFAIGEVLTNMESRDEPQVLPVPKGVRNLLPTMQDLRDCRFAFAQGSVIGFLVGVLPGAGSTIASFISYGVEKAFSRRREEFGTGVIEGVAAPEGPHHSATGGAPL